MIESKNMKHIILVPDGVADEPLSVLGGKTPLEAAKTPYMDQMAKEGLSGLVKIIPQHMAPGSDVGNISVLGYDATKGFSGRAPLEAANLGVLLKDDEIAFRCNLVTIENDEMIDYSAGHISVEEAADIMCDIDKALSDECIKFHTGKSYRQLAVMKTKELMPFLKMKCTPPHDIMGKNISLFLPQGEKRDFLLSYVQKAKEILRQHPVNQKRIALKKRPATDLWFWGQGDKPKLEPFVHRYGLTGSIISAVDLVNGIGRAVGLNVITVEGANGYYDTNYQGKAQSGLASLKEHDFIYIHVEATDEAGHNGDMQAKVSCIEKFDEYIVKQALSYAHQHPDTRILVCPDHATPVSKRTHTSTPVPFVMCGKNIEHNGLDHYNEVSASLKGVLFQSGVEMIERFMK